MHSFEFHRLAPGASAEAAFEAAREAARETHGRSGRTGTIADVSGVVPVPGEPVTKQRALSQAEFVLAAEIESEIAESCHSIELLVAPGEPRTFLLFGQVRR